MNFFPRFDAERPNAADSAEPGARGPVSVGNECRLAFHPLDAIHHEDIERRRAHLMTLVATAGLQITETAREMHRFSPSAGHHPGHVVLAGALSAAIYKIHEDEAVLENDPDAAKSLFVRDALEQAHGLDRAMKDIPIIKLKQVLGDPDMPESSPDPEFDPNGLMIRPGPAGVDELTV